MKYLTGRELNLGPLDCDPITLTTRPLGRDGRVAPASPGHPKGARQAQAALERTLRELPAGPNPVLVGRGGVTQVRAGPVSAATPRMRDSRPDVLALGFLFPRLALLFPTLLKHFICLAVIGT